MRVITIVVVCVSVTLFAIAKPKVLGGSALSHEHNCEQYHNDVHIHTLMLLLKQFQMSDVQQSTATDPAIRRRQAHQAVLKMLTQQSTATGPALRRPQAQQSTATGPRRPLDL